MDAGKKGAKIMNVIPPWGKKSEFKKEGNTISIKLILF
jgi:hypothetical protein